MMSKQCMSLTMADFGSLCKRSKHQLYPTAYPHTAGLLFITRKLRQANFNLSRQCWRKFARPVFEPWTENEVNYFQNCKVTWIHTYSWRSSSQFLFFDLCSRTQHYQQAVSRGQIQLAPQDAAGRAPSARRLVPQTLCKSSELYSVASEMPLRLEARSRWANRHTDVANSPACSSSWRLSET